MVETYFTIKIVVQVIAFIAVATLLSGAMLIAWCTRRCPSKNGPFRCNLPRGHKGMHEGEYYTRW